MIPETWVLVVFVLACVVGILFARWLYSVFLAWRERHHPFEPKVDAVLDEARKVQLDIDDLVCGRRPRHG